MSESDKIYFQAMKDYAGKIGRTIGNYPAGTFHDLQKAGMEPECKHIEKLVKKGTLKFVTPAVCEAGIKKQFEEYEAEIKRRRAANDNNVDAPKATAEGTAETK